ncbi:hypothetical protein [Bacillus cihuensis]|uniref:hypothetical protein n=1 Tax=Bacillus cihuensis TaxID=1208599 RepID=UPI000684434F|nr:hypothetical protein [Bacillus cihuensis]
MNVTCDVCTKDFDVNLKEYEHPVSRIKGYVIETYFRCPHCKKKYISFVTDKQARKVQQEINRFSKQKLKINFRNMTEEEYKSAINEHHKKLDEMKQELTERMNMLKEEVKALD